jgi:hypothetical protein
MRNQAGLCPGFLFHRGQKVFEQDVKSFEVKRLKIIAAAAAASKCFFPKRASQLTKDRLSVFHSRVKPYLVFSGNHCRAYVRDLPKV